MHKIDTKLSHSNQKIAVNVIKKEEGKKKSEEIKGTVGRGRMCVNVPEKKVRF